MRYNNQRKVRYNNNKGFNEDTGRSSPFLINKDFNNQYKRKMSVNNTGINTVDYTPKPKLSDEEYHKQNENGLEQAYNSPSHLYKKQ
jgi:hypothetical protein